MSAAGRVSVGVVGARGHVGRELLALLQAHRRFEVAYVSSRRLAGQPVPGAGGVALRYEDLAPAEVGARAVDACVLALPNGLAAPYVEALDAGRRDTVILDLSGDHRFDARWHYGLPELTREEAGGRRRIANPGCYATGMQIAIAPLRHRLAAAPVCFGVSGYSGAGTTPSPRNDPAMLADNLLPYALSGHLHEREVAHRLDYPVTFVPHVASFFRGISLTVVLPVDDAGPAVEEIYREFYGGEPLVRVTAQPPTVREVQQRHHVAVGGFTRGADGRLIAVAALDNLLKGAATQALQNLNLAFGFEELEGIGDG